MKEKSILSRFGLVLLALLALVLMRKDMLQLFRMCFN